MGSGRRPPALAALSLLLAGAARGEIHSMGAARAGARSLLQAAPAPTHRIPVNVVVLAGSHWLAESVERRVSMTRAILTQCAIALEPAIAVREPPWGSALVLYDDKRSEEPNGMGSVSRLLRPSAAPTLFYVEDFEDNEAQTGTSRPPFTSAGRPEVDTAWIRFADHLPRWSDAYHVDAHELVHVLADTGHSALPTFGRGRGRKEDPADPASQDGGLMAGNPFVRSNRIAAELCEKMKAHPFARRL